MYSFPFVYVRHNNYVRKYHIVIITLHECKSVKDIKAGRALGRHGSWCQAPSARGHGEVLMHGKTLCDLATLFHRH